MIIVPNSHGSDLREYNQCHNPSGPAGGQFCSDPKSSRAVYGQQVDDEQALAFNAREALRADTALNPDGDRTGAKDLIAKTLAQAIVDHPGLDALANDPHLGSWGQRYDAGLTPPNPTEQATKNKYAIAQEDFEAGLNKGAPDPNKESVRDAYDEYVAEGGEAGGAPSPDEAESDYEDYRQEAEDKAYDEARDAAYGEAVTEYEKEGEKLADSLSSDYDDAREAFQYWRKERLDAGELDPDLKGDVSTHPSLPGLEDVKHTPVEDRYTQEEILRQYAEDGDDAAFLNDAEYMATVEALPAFDREQALEGTEYDPNDEQAREKFIDKWTEGVEPDYSDIDSFSTWYEGKYGFHPDEWESKQTIKDFEQWYADKYTIFPSEWQDPSDATFKSFEDWYTDKYGIAPSSWKPGGNSEARVALARNVASSLIHAWAETSSDQQLRSVMMQLAAAEHFKLGSVYDQSLKSGGVVYYQAHEVLDKHRAILTTFLDAMHQNTQTWLKEKGIGKDGYVTLYRGWAARTAQEPGLETVDTRRGTLVDVLLQPMSSFSSSFGTAKSFASSGGADLPLVMAMRVPITKILGTARTGYGCLNESEFVILGGRYPAFIQTTRDTDLRDGSDLVASAVLAAARKYRPRVVPGAGDRL